MRKRFNLFGDYYLLLSEAKYRTKYREALKILTPRQANASNVINSFCTSKRKFRKFIKRNQTNYLYKLDSLLYQSKEITKKVYNKIIK